MFTGTLFADTVYHRHFTSEHEFSPHKKNKSLTTNEERFILKCNDTMCAVCVTVYLCAVSPRAMAVNDTKTATRDENIVKVPY